MSTDDETIIKRRLLIDGIVGDDRRLNQLSKSFIKWCISNDSPDNNKIMCDRLLAQVSQAEYSIKKSELTEKMIYAELENYDQISKCIQEGIETVKKKIFVYKDGLVEAKRIRQNKMEYDVLAKVINQQPDRIATINRHEKLNSELNAHHEKEVQLSKRLEQKRKEFSVLMNSLNELEELYNSTTGNDSDLEIIDDLESDLLKDDDKMSVEDEVI